MHIVTAGSVASDHLMTYEGRFSESLGDSDVDGFNASFLVSDLQVRRGGVSANISYGLSQLGVPSTLFAAVGNDFDTYAQEFGELAPHVDLGELFHDKERATARFTCTTDASQNQLASFYPGAMSSAHGQSLTELHERRPIDIAIISPNDPAAMRLHTSQCRDAGIAFVADPSQQVSFMDAETIDDLVTGARYLFSNAHEARMMADKLGCTVADLTARVDNRVETRGDQGSVAYLEGGTIEVGIAPVGEPKDPTGSGDAFRSGYFAARAWGLSPLDCMQVGTTIASFVLEVVGPQEYHVDHEPFLTRHEEAFGPKARSLVEEHLHG